MAKITSDLFVAIAWADDRVELLEKLALSWINLAIMQGHGRDIAFKIVRR